MRARGLLLSPVVAACLCGGAVLAWPTWLGVVLSSAERVDAAAPIAGLAAAMSLGILLIGGRRAAPAACALPPIALAAAVWGPPPGLSWDAAPPRVWGPALAALALAPLWRSRASAALSAAAVFAAPLALWAAGLRPPSLPPAPRIVLITLDTLRADHLDFMGGDVEIAYTPNLSALAAQSVVFRQAYSPQPITGPAHASLFSGQHPTEHGLRVNAQAVPGEIPWAPAILADAGWRPRAFVSTTVLDGRLGFERGFERYDSTFQARVERGLPPMRWRGWRTGGELLERRGDQTVALALEHLSDFTWIHLYDAHWPYTPTEDAAARVGVAPTPLEEDPRGPVPRPLHPKILERGGALYRAEIEDLDRRVGALLDALPDDVSVIVAGDHGESMGEHDYAFSHGSLAFAPDTRVPLMLRAPDLSPGVVDVPVTLQDVAPTLLALADLEAPPEMTGRSLLDPDPDRVITSVAFSRSVPLPLMLGPGLDFSTSSGPYSSLAARSAGGSVAASRWSPPARYALAADPRELRPQPIEDNDPLAAQIDQMKRDAMLPEPEIEEEMEEALRALGYVE